VALQERNVVGTIVKSFEDINPGRVIGNMTGDGTNWFIPVIFKLQVVLGVKDNHPEMPVVLKSASALLKV
jgi:hypothetical protein